MNGEQFVWADFWADYWVALLVIAAGTIVLNALIALWVFWGDR